MKYTKKIQLLVGLLFFFPLAKGQNTTGYTGTRNYTAEKTYIEPTSQTGSSSAKTVSDIVYFDGFGLKWQEIQVGASPSGGADLILPHSYGTLGQVEKEYLPYIKCPDSKGQRNNK